MLQPAAHGGGWEAEAGSRGEVQVRRKKDSIPAERRGAEGGGGRGKGRGSREGRGMMTY